MSNMKQTLLFLVVVVLPVANSGNSDANRENRRRRVKSMMPKKTGSIDRQAANGARNRQVKGKIRSEHAVFRDLSPKMNRRLGASVSREMPDGEATKYRSRVTVSCHKDEFIARRRIKRHCNSLNNGYSVDTGCSVSKKKRE